jgi:16S rRNA (uracil1498-N3)-methyltransferase
MECFIVEESDIDQVSGTLTLRGDEARHAVRVLRISEGEHLMATTLGGTCYKAICQKSGQPSKNEWVCECSIDEVLPEHNESRIDVRLIQGITQQQSKLEEIVEKATEMGIASISPIFTKRTEKRTITRERLDRIIRSGCKQSHRARMPLLSDAMSLEESLDLSRSEGRSIIILHESAPWSDALAKFLPKDRAAKVTLIVGPEGGFDEGEVLLARKFGAIVASLGPRRLRAETAAIMAVSVTMGLSQLLNAN